MGIGRIAFLFVVAFLATAVVASAPALAFLGECSVVVPKKHHKELADKTEVRLKDAAEHREIDFKMRGKTFGELEPGDIVDAHGEPHMLHEVTHRVDWSQYTFVKQSDLDDHAARLSRPRGN